ncbi:thioredoxin family protein [Membranicola marinus]|uniref:Thioredoxin family protein n=1 Tax=Membranihabitans marinus TaxID=1227546 RepID=A0A953HLF3_9BACT|nr:thioredoxin family protein [Membranihabitans marinus]MBY5957244.1 thioredoxin family protein [Membranihabitans marinus]
MKILSQLSLPGLITGLVLMFLGTGISQEDYTAHNEGWMVSVEEAQAVSQKTGKPIMANFTGSDWCGWCKRLTASVFSKDEFKKWADENVVLLELDFPRRTKLPKEIQQQNYSLQKAFKVTGYPTVWVFYLKPNEETGQMNIDPVGRTGYKPSAKAFIDEVDQMIAAKQ